MSGPNDWGNPDGQPNHAAPDNRPLPPHQQPGSYEAEKADGLAVVCCVAGIMGITGLVCLPAVLFSLIAVVTGIISMSRLTKGSLNGISKVMSVIGLGTGLIGMSWLLFIPLALLL